ncbi:MAG: DUF3108 domain-containing protein [Polyangiaceae bacterium]
MLRASPALLRTSLRTVGALVLAPLVAGCQFFFPMPLDPTIEPGDMEGATAVVTSGESFREGEVFDAEVYVEGVAAGKAHLEVGKKCLADGKLALPLTGSGELGGLLSFVSSGSAETFALVDAATSVPLEAHWDITLDDKRSVAELDYGPGKYRLHQTRYDVEIEDKKKGTDSYKRTSLKTDQTPHDGHSLLGYLRRWDAAEGMHGFAYVLMGRHLLRTDVVMSGVEDLRMGTTTYSAIRIDGVATRLEDRTLKPLPRYVPKPFTLWFTNDDARRPLRIEVETELATLTIDVTSAKVVTIPSGPPEPCAKRVDKSSLEKARSPRKTERRPNPGQPTPQQPPKTPTPEPAKPEFKDDPNGGVIDRLRKKRVPPAEAPR